MTKQSDRHASKEALKAKRDESRAEDDSRYEWVQYVKGALTEPPKATK